MIDSNEKSSQSSGFNSEGGWIFNVEPTCLKRADWHHSHQNKKMSQNKSQKENSQKAVISSQAEVDSQPASTHGPATITFDDRVQSQVNPGQSQDRVPSQVNDSQDGSVSAQETVQTQPNVSTHDAASQATVPSRPQLSQTGGSIHNSPCQSQEKSQSQKRSQYDEKENIQKLETIPEYVSRSPSQNSQDLKKPQSDSQGRDCLASCTQILFNGGSQQTTDE